MSPVIPRRCLSIALSLVFLVSLFLALRVTAQDVVEPAGPDAPGSIAGTVTDRAGVPLAGILVELDNRDSFLEPVRTTSTDGAGAYRFGALAAGLFRVRFRDPGGIYALQYFSASNTTHAAVELAIAGNDVTGVDARLPVAGAISGTVRNTTARWFDTWLRAYAADGAGVWHPASSLVEVTASLGGYSLTGLAPGVYRVCATLPYWHGIGLSCWPDTVAGVGSGGDVTVASGATTQPIDILYGAEHDWPQIGGRVTGAGGAALPGVEVTAYMPSAPFWSSVTMTRTDANGLYRFAALAPGEYVFGFADTNGLHLSRYFDGADRPEEARPVAAGAGTVRLDVDSVLPLGAQITGTVTLAGEAPPPYGFVEILPLSDGDPTVLKHVPLNLATGGYVAGGLPAGRYYVRALGMDYAAAFVGYYKGATTLTAATLITLTSGQAIGDIDIELAIGAYEGALEGTVRSGEGPRAGVRVLLYSGTASSYPGLQPLVYAETDTEGRYRLEGLLEGTYRIGFQDPAGIYGTIFYSGTRNFDAAQMVGVFSGGRTGRFDQSLERGGAISGQVRSTSGAPLSEVAVLFYVVEPLALSNWPPAYPFYVSTGADGRYLMRGLPPGLYRVCFVPQKPPYYPAKCYGSLDFLGTADGANVLVRPGEATAGIDALLGPQVEARSYLPLIQP